MKLYRSIAFMLFVFFCATTYGQDKNTGTGPGERSIKSERKLRKMDRKAAREKRKKERAERKAIKAHHKRIQGKEVTGGTVRKRMKRSKNTARLHNENKREFFVKRWFKKKKKT